MHNCINSVTRPASLQLCWCLADMCSSDTARPSRATCEKGNTWLGLLGAPAGRKIWELGSWGSSPNDSENKDCFFSDWKVLGPLSIYKEWKGEARSLFVAINGAMQNTTCATSWGKPSRCSASQNVNVNTIHWFRWWNAVWRCLKHFETKHYLMML